MANHPTPLHGNVLPFRGYAGPAAVKRRDLPLGQALRPTIDRLREIAALSWDHLVTDGPVHPDHRLLDLSAAALDLITQADDAQAVRQAMFERGRAWTDADRARGDALHDRRHALSAAASKLLVRAGKLRAVTPAGVYAKALLVRSSVTGASELGKSLANDLIACHGLQQTLSWPDVRAETGP